MPHEKPVLLAHDRWAALTARIGEALDSEQVTLYALVEVDGILFLPAVYRAA